MKERNLEQAKALDAIMNTGYRCRLVASMRAGKTKIAIDAINRLAPKSILWVTNEAKLRDKDIPEEFKKFNAKEYLKKLTTIHYSSLKKLKGNYELVILDEYQAVTESNMQNFKSKDIVYDHIIMMTGKEPTSFEKQELISWFNLPKAYTLTVDDASEKGIIADYNIWIKKFKLEDTFPTIKTKKGKLVTERMRYDQLSYVINNNPFSPQTKFIINARMHLLYGSKVREKELQKLLIDLTANNTRGLIFHPYKKNAEKYKYFYHSTSTEKHYNNFKNFKTNQLHLVNKGGTGHTYNEVDYVVISQVNSDITGLTSQKWARGLLNDTNNPKNIYMLCATDTQDEIWLQKSLKHVDETKVFYI